MIAERETLKLGIEHLTVLFPTKVSSFVFQVESTNRTVKYKFNVQSLRLFGLRNDVTDARRADATLLQNKQILRTNGDFIQINEVLMLCNDYNKKQEKNHTQS